MASSSATTSKSVNFRSSGLAATIILVSVAHIPVLFSDTVLWDSTLIRYAQETGDYEPFLLRGSMEGNTLVANFHIAMGHLPGTWTIYRILSFCCYGVAAFGIYRVISACPLFSSQEAALISAMSMMFPSLVLWQEPIMVIQALCIAAFWCAAAWRLRQLQNGSATIAALTATSLLFFFSFLTESLLVFQFVLFLYFFLVLSAEWSRRRLVAFIASNAWYLALPLLFYFWKRWTLPKHGRLAEYNTLQLSNLPFLLPKGFFGNAKRMVFDQLVELAEFIRSEPWFFAELGIAALIVISAAYFALPDGKSERTPTFRTTLFAICFAAIAYAAAVLPYAAVNKFPQLDRYFARHAVLIYVPLSAAFVILIKHTFTNATARRFVTTAALALLIIQTLRSEVRLQIQYIKALGIIENLRGQDAQLAGVVVFDDHTQLGIKEPFNTYELGWILYKGLGNRRHLGFDVSDFTPTSTSTWITREEYKAMFYRDFQHDGRISHVDIESDNPRNNLHTYLSYLCVADEHRRSVAKSLIRLNFENLSSPANITSDASTESAQFTGR